MMGTLPGSRPSGGRCVHRSDGMLVLTRFEGQKVVIGNPAKPIAVIEVSSIRGDRVRLVFTADRSVPINREEIAAEIVARGPRKGA